MAKERTSPSGLTRLFIHDGFIMWLIVINTFVLFCDSYTSTPQWLTYADSLLTVLFILEVCLKIKFYGFKDYWQVSWNKLDFVVTLLSTPSLLQLFLSNSFFSSIGVLLVLRSFRLLRIIKSVRIIHFLPGINQLMKSIKLGIKASYFIIFTFLIFLLVISLITWAIFSPYDPEHFSTPMQSIYSVFIIFTTEGWYDIPNAICGSMASSWEIALVRLYFVLLLFFGGILGMSFINSIIVDAMTSDNTEELEKEVKQLEQKIDALTELMRQKDNKG